MEITKNIKQRKQNNKQTKHEQIKTTTHKHNDKTKH